LARHHPAPGLSAGLNERLAGDVAGVQILVQKSQQCLAQQLVRAQVLDS